MNLASIEILPLQARALSAVTPVVWLCQGDTSPPAPLLWTPASVTDLGAARDPFPVHFLPKVLWVHTTNAGSLSLSPLGCLGRALAWGGRLC